MDIEVDAYRCAGNDRLLIVKRKTPKAQVERLATSLAVKLATGTREKHPSRVDVELLEGNECALTVWSKRWGSD